MLLKYTLNESRRSVHVRTEDIAMVTPLDRDEGGGVELTLKSGRRAIVCGTADLIAAEIALADLGGDPRERRADARNQETPPGPAVIKLDAADALFGVEGGAQINTQRAATIERLTLALKCQETIRLGVGFSVVPDRLAAFRVVSVSEQENGYTLIQLRHWPADAPDTVVAPRAVPLPADDHKALWNFEIEITNGSSRIAITLDQYERGMKGEVVIYYSPDGFTPEQMAFIKTLREVRMEGGSMTLEVNGRKYTGVRIVEMTDFIQ